MSTAIQKRDPARELIVLGLLRRKPMSAYTVDIAVRNHVPLYRPFKQGNVYHLIDSLTQRGLLRRRSAAAKRGPRESKDVFRLSAAGEEHFKELLAQTLSDVQAGDVAIETALVLLGQLPRAQAAKLLTGRLSALAEHEGRVERLWGGTRDRRGAAYLAAAHHAARLKAERRFAADALKRLNDPGWCSEWRQDDGAITEPSRAL